MARDPKRHFAERLLHRLSAGGGGRTLPTSGVGLEGNVLGVFVMRSVSQKGGGFGMFNFRPQGLTTIILPAEDILKAAKQAPEAKGDEKKSDAKESAETKDKDKKDAKP